MSDEMINAQASQGLISNPQAAVNQQFGDQQQVETQGGDAAGRDVDKSTTIINYFISGGNPASLLATLPQKLLSILEQVESFDRVQQAYRDSLLPYSKDARPEVSDSQAILAQLQDFGRLLEFICRLIQDDKIALPIRQKLKELIGTAAYSNGINSVSPPPQTAAILQAYLLVVVTPVQTSPDRFRVNGWLIPDDSIEDVYARFQPLDLADPQKGVDCPLEEIPAVLDQFLEQSIANHLAGKRYDLTIEVFLPLSHLCTHVEAWQILDVDESFAMGSEYPVHIRSCERLDQKYLKSKRSKLNKWYDNWHRVKQVLGAIPDHEGFERLEQLDACNWEQLALTLTQKLGLKLTCSPAASHKELFMSMLDAAVPIAIWSRSSLPNINLATAIDEVLTASPLNNLAKHMLEKRRVAYASGEPEKHLAYHLTVLWEDPHRLTPDAHFLLTGQ